MNKKKLTKSLTRRKFLTNTATAGAGLLILPRHVLGGQGHTAPSDRLNIAGIGAAGKGYSDLAFCSGYDKKTGNTLDNIVALCDVDDSQMAKSAALYPKAKRFRDYREMFDQMSDQIDAVIVSTPDHMHAVQAMAAMKRGKHVYVQKPLAHDIHEVRMLTEAAHKYNVVTQMGNQGNSSEGIRQICEWIWGGAIGEVREVHSWTNRPAWPQGIPTPTEKQAIPATMDWDLWLGTAPHREYNCAYHPQTWRGWWDFGTGALGDMACHIIDPVFKSLKLGYPTAVQCSVGQVLSGWFELDYNADSCPPSSVIHFDFPAREELPPVKLHWYDGGILPERPEEMGDETFNDMNGGVIFKGDKGILVCDVYAANPVLYPKAQYRDYEYPKPVLKRIEQGHYRDWVDACKSGEQPSSNFDYSGPLSETILMGNLAIRSHGLSTGKGPFKTYPGRKKLHWDGGNMKITNFEPANQFVKRSYRGEWSL